MTKALAKRTADDLAAKATLEVMKVGEEMTVDAMVARKAKIKKVMELVMKEGEHYGVIPGTNKPTLLKAGAEVLATTFQLAPTFEIRRTDFENGHREYEITCTLTHIQTGAVLGQGVGSCSTMEKKYRWRNGERKCPSCGVSAIIKGKAEYGGGWLCFQKKGGCGSKWSDGAPEIESQETGRVENPDLADTYNTVLKMAKKRAQVDCTLTAVGASDILTQDLEDMAPEQRGHDQPMRGPQTKRTQAKKNGTEPRIPFQQIIDTLSRDDEMEASAIATIEKVAKATEPGELEEVSRVFNALPKGSRARHAVWDAMQLRNDQLHDDIAF